MSLDLTKLTPAPWHVEKAWSEIVGEVWQVMGPRGLVGKFLQEQNAEECCLARNAFDVMTRRGWNPRCCGPRGWIVQHEANYDVDETPADVVPGVFWPDPFTALVEADKWYKEHVEA